MGFLDKEEHMKRLIMVSFQLAVAGMILPFMGYRLVKDWITDYDPFNTEDSNE